MLPEDVLLEMIDFYVGEDMDRESYLYEKHIVGWVKLAHVCRRWRRIVSQSPTRLNLRLVCTRSTPARDTLNIWPPLPLIIFDFEDIFGFKPLDVDNIIAALEHNDRVCRIKLDRFSSSEFDFITNSAAMQKPFLELTYLRLCKFVYNELESIIPNSFMGGTAPRLQSFFLHAPFPGLPKLLCSAAHLVNLELYVPQTGYIPPKSMATGLSALTSLEFLRLHFLHPPPRPSLESRLSPPPSLTRSILPNLTKIIFQGASEYFEVILARIDAPRLADLDIVFFNQIIFDTPQLFQSIGRRPTLRAPETGHIEFSHASVTFRFPSHSSDFGVLQVAILCRVSEWQLSYLEQVCTSSLPPVFTLKDLYIHEGSLTKLRWQDDVENVVWLELLRPFAAVENLYVCEEFVPRIAPALQELVGGRMREALPTLENIFLDGFQLSGPLHEGVRCRTTAHQSPCSSFSLGQIMIQNTRRRTGRSMVPFAFYVINVSCFLLTTTISFCTHLYTFLNTTDDEFIVTSADKLTRSPCRVDLSGAISR